MLAGGLVLGAGDVHVVKKGDTLYGISRRYGTSIDAILEANDGALTRKTVLRPGMEIRLPTGEEPRPDAAAVEETTTVVVVEEETVEAPAAAKEDKAAAKTKDKAKAKSPARTEQVYRVVKGDSLYRIGRRFGMSVSEIKSLNGLRSDRLTVGETLRVMAPPGTLEEAPATPRYLFITDIKDQIDDVDLDPDRWKYIVVHHSGTASGNARIFDHFHKEIRGMENGLAYHFVIGDGHGSGDGEIEVGDRWRKQLQGGHLASEDLNEIAIGICFVGDFNRTRPTKKQIAAAIELISYLNKKMTVPPAFMAHREINPKPTECPGNKFPVRVFHELFDGT